MIDGVELAGRMRLARAGANACHAKKIDGLSHLVDEDYASVRRELVPANSRPSDPTSGGVRTQNEPNVKSQWWRSSITPFVLGDSLLECLALPGVNKQPR